MIIKKIRGNLEPSFRSFVRKTEGAFPGSVGRVAAAKRGKTKFQGNEVGGGRREGKDAADSGGRLCLQDEHRWL